jgi:hypothetical protein
MEKKTKADPAPRRPPGADSAASAGTADRPIEPAYCTKAFDAESARADDPDEPCVNGEG